VRLHQPIIGVVAIRQIVHQPRARFALMGLAVLQQAAFDATNNLMFLLFLFYF
jgi:hypothetical protein